MSKQSFSLKANQVSLIFALDGYQTIGRKIIIYTLMEERRNMENPSRATMRVLKSMRWIATHSKREGLTALDLVTEYEEANGFRYCTESRESIARLYERIYGGH